MTGPTVGILYSAYDALRSLVAELSEHLSARKVVPIPLLIEDLRGYVVGNSYPETVVVLSNHAETPNVAAWLQTLGVRIVNGHFFRLRLDRISVKLCLKQLGVPVLPFAFGGHPSVFTDTSLWNRYPAILKSRAKSNRWPVVHSIGELHDWIEETVSPAFGWLIEEFVQAPVTIKCYFVDDRSYAVDKRGRDDMRANINEEADVTALGFRIAQGLALEVGSVDMVRDVNGNLWPIDINVVPAFRVWPEGYKLLADYLARKAAITVSC